MKLFITLLVFLSVLIPAAFGQTNSVPPVSSPGAAPNLTLTQWLIPIAVPIVIAAMKWGLGTFGFKIPSTLLPLIAMGLGALADYAATGSGKYGAALGAAGTGLREVVDQVQKLMNGEPTKAVTSLLIFGFCLAPFTLTSGCSRKLDPAGAYKGDEILYRADLTITSGYELLRGFLKWELDNRAMLTKTPEITKSADAIRKDIKKWFSTAMTLRDAYASNPTSENRSALQAALSVIQTAMAEATKYLAQGAVTPVESRPPPPPPVSRLLLLENAV